VLRERVRAVVVVVVLTGFAALVLYIMLRPYDLPCNYEQRQISLICWFGLNAIIRCCTTRSGESICAAKKNCTRTPLECRRSRCAPF
jgi:hypothetical protein